MTFDEAAEKYVRRLLISKNSTSEALDIVESIKKLTYEGTAQKLTDDDKRAIVEEMRAFSKRNLFKMAGDNKDVLDLVTLISNYLKV